MASLFYEWKKEQSTIRVQVDYDPKSDTVNEVLGAWAVHPTTNKLTPIGDVLCEWFGLDSLVDRIYWRAIYRKEEELEYESVDE